MRETTDLPVDGLPQGERVGACRGGGGQFGVVNIMRLSIQLQRTKHTCWENNREMYLVTYTLVYFSMHRHNNTGGFLV